MIDLSPALEKICQLVAQGLSDKEITDILHIKIGTVRLQVCNVRKRFGAKNRTALALMYLEDRGYIKFQKVEKDKKQFAIYKK